MELRGRAQLERKLQPETIKKPIAANIKKIIVWFMSHVQRSTPVDTARLRSSITQLTTDDEGKVTTNVAYAPFVEYGHSQEVGRYVHAIGKRLVAPFVPPSRVQHGTSMRIRDMGPFTYTVQESKTKIEDWLKELGLSIRQRFG